MESFWVNHLVEILFGLVAAGSLAFCKYLQSQIKNYKKLLDEKKDEKMETTIEERLEPIVTEIEESNGKFIIFASFLGVFNRVKPSNSVNPCNILLVFVTFDRSKLLISSELKPVF